ncbi:FMN-binding protein [Roseimaritima ulvae]|uniref:Electron transport complex subunit RsxG n=1 Tax=Roseimaritima ulvae TaxID=980254 RepID=A0A5B9QJP9_9BACT|nr:FMN-binding protein [Roseimaritima ulvae]QEG39154.1 Electron transport complex subunit RsxG [Roseimaritima ulvae]
MPDRSPALPVASPSSARPLPSRRRSLIVHVLRWVLVGLLLLTLRYADQQRRLIEQRQPARFDALPTETLTQWFGPTATTQPLQADSGERLVYDADEQLLGRLLITLPQAREVTGYRGPSNVLIGIDSNRRVLGARLLSSQDTVDHVEAIEQSDSFFQQFSGRDAAGVLADVDVVSGATLTSLAIRDSIALRLGAAVPLSTRFPEPLSLPEARSLFADAASMEVDDHQIAEVLGGDGQPLGTLARSGVLEDHLNGYQGPTELLIAFDENDQLREVRIRKSFDNQPYVSYVTEEPWFWDPFRGQSWQQLAAADLQALQVEGVSGATMTSVAAAETLVAAAQRQQQLEQAPVQTPTGPTIRWSWKEYATLGILCGSMLMAWTRLRGYRRLRIGWQWVLVIGLGLLTGNLLSVALLMGWSSSGVAWKLAPGLTAVLFAAFWFAGTSKTPFYCAHVCPHGAIQQQLRGRLPARLRWHPSPRQSYWLQQIPLALLVAAYWVTLTGSGIDLASWEPFDAYLWWTGAGGSLLLAIGSLALSASSPMGYCRFGCPTGHLLSRLRWHRRAGNWTRSDWLVVGLLLASWVYLWAHKNSG